MEALAGEGGAWIYTCPDCGKLLVIRYGADGKVEGHEWVDDTVLAVEPEG